MKKLNPISDKAVSKIKRQKYIIRKNLSVGLFNLLKTLRL